MTKAGLAELRNEWAARVAAFRASGKSASAWCAEHDLKIHQLRYWLRKHSAPRMETGDAPTQWLPLNLATPPLVTWL